MKKASVLLACLAVLGLGAYQLALANPTIIVDMTGAQEPNGGDPDGSGVAAFGLSPGADQICYKLTVSGIAPATAAHIHRAPAGVVGPVVVTLIAPTSGSSQGCVSVDSKLLKEIQQHPEEFYVNVHNADYPGGAIRAQLKR